VLGDARDSSLEAWARGRARTDGGLEGRGTIFVFAAPAPGPDGRAGWALRHYRRGGLVAPLLGDRYLVAGPSRPSIELRASVAARARGVPTPAVVAGLVERGSTGVLYRADLVTELVPDARSLRDVLFATATPLGREAAREQSPDTHEALRLSGRLVRSLADAGIEHADLNAGNVLLTTRDAWVIDLDRCRVRSRGRRSAAATMLRRLERSLRKLSRAHARPLSRGEWSALREGWTERA